MTDAVKMAKEALMDIRTSIECAAGCDEGIDPMAAVSEVMSAYGTAMASAYSRAADMVNILAALEQAGEPVAGIGHDEEADYAELKRLYNFSDDDSAQFTRWNMLTAIRHGKRLGQEFDAGEGLAKRVAETMDEDGGCWSACSGCQESFDGYVSTRDYPYSPIFKCQPGSGCRECGGIGVVWQDGNFLASYGDALAINQTERVYEPYPGAFDDLIGPESAATPAEHDGENVLAKLEAIRDVVAAAYYACEDSEDDGGDNIHVMRSSWERLSASLDAIDGIMPDEVQPALPAALVTLVMEAFARQSRGQAFDGEGEATAIIEGMLRLADLGFEESMREPQENGNFAVYERAKRYLAALSSAKRGEVG